jgi:hypothetical protein
MIVVVSWKLAIAFDRPRRARARSVAASLFNSLHIIVSRRVERTATSPVTTTYQCFFEGKVSSKKASFWLVWLLLDYENKPNLGCLAGGGQKLF